MSRLTRIVAALGATVLAAGLAACGANTSSTASSDTSTPLTVIADSTPHSEIIQHAIDSNLLGDVKITLREATGDIDQNQLVLDGDVDANFFQHVPYLKDWNAQHDNAPLVSVAAVHVEPLGLYSKKVSAVADTPEGATIAIPSDATNQARALFLLADAGLVTLDVKATDPDLDYSQVTTKNITDNPKKISFVTLERRNLPGSLDDAKVTLSIINGNYALEAGLTPEKDALVLESATDNPYANVLVVKDTLKDDPRVTKLAEALTSSEIAEYITQTYKGSVLPVNA
ncbi:MetQ/NlpA family ABC transporter substrate-binding protein [Propionicicella superfundia]|uniref:MetQ/NlpA family ABC transporter substrate-binding protein n=1 Tax=Propionicicella superfundia TaxID=348582 RepID=UPI0004133FE8|nr:MetQ/NlpA family ABC transporter substrate-binding protein [Propionicicella superfundia]